MKKGRKSLNRIDPKVKDVLKLLGTGSFLLASIFMPGLPIIAKPFLNKKYKDEKNEWKKFNAWRLKQVLNRLEAEKLIEINESREGQVVKLTQKGKQKLLKYNIEDMSLNKSRWDKKWRIIIYDVSESKSYLRRLFQFMLKKLEFLQLQKSVYLTPYPCEDEVEFLRQIYSIGSDVIILTVSGLEKEQAYKDYFGLS